MEFATCLVGESLPHAGVQDEGSIALMNPFAPRFETTTLDPPNQADELVDCKIPASPSLRVLLLLVVSVSAASARRVGAVY